MGNWWGHRTRSDIEEVALPPNTYHFGPGGDSLANYFFMGDKRHTVNPQQRESGYLFGDNFDLNFLNKRPVTVPYHLPSSSEPVSALKSLVFIRKDTVRLVKKYERNTTCGGSDADDAPPCILKYNIEFTFDSEVNCGITIYQSATEDFSNGANVYTTLPCNTSRRYHYKPGASQVFSQSTFVLDPSVTSDRHWQYDPQTNVFPLVIHCVVQNDAATPHSHTLYASLEKTNQAHYSVKPLKQKQIIDGIPFVMQEIFGIDSKPYSKNSEEDLTSNGLECSVCFTHPRDTLTLPCKHLSLCHSECATRLRDHLNNCPICRAPFRALLAIKVRKPTTEQPDPNLPRKPTTEAYEDLPLGKMLTYTSTEQTDDTEETDVMSQDTAATQKREPINEHDVASSSSGPGEQLKIPKKPRRKSDQRPVCENCGYHNPPSSSQDTPPLPDTPAVSGQGQDGADDHPAERQPLTSDTDVVRCYHGDDPDPSPPVSSRTAPQSLTLSSGSSQGSTISSSSDDGATIGFVHSEDGLGDTVILMSKLKPSPTLPPTPHRHDCHCYKQGDVGGLPQTNQSAAKRKFNQGTEYVAVNQTEEEDEDEDISLNHI